MYFLVWYFLQNYSPIQTTNIFFLQIFRLNCILFTTLLRATRPAHLVLLHFFTPIIFPKTHKMYEVLYYVILFVLLLLPFS